MANFTINSLSEGTPISTDTFLKSDTSGALTKATGSALKIFVIGNSDISEGGASVTEAIASTCLAHTTTRINSAYFSYEIPVKRTGNTCNLDLIGNKAASDIPSNTKIATLPDGYKPTALLQQRGIGLAKDALTSDLYVVLFTMQNGDIYISASGHGNKINQNDLVYAIPEWMTVNSPA